jgi:hypothetical protein
MEDLEEAWTHFCDGDYNNETSAINNEVISTPKCSELYISTKTKISYLNTEVNLSDVFWKIPVIQYHMPVEGIIKKQMKFNSLTPDELSHVTKQVEHERTNTVNHIDEYIIHQNYVPNSRNAFKDVRKISIGLSKKDITSYKCKKKSAFYNCFVTILRLKHGDIFKEHSVKVFNTGKMQIPGIQTDDTLNKILDLLMLILTPICNTTVPINYFKDKHQTVLINSNFNCGYYIDRDKLYNTLKFTYNINSAYDPCSYPGIQCEFYYLLNSNLEQTGKQPTNYEDNVIKVSFMIFRTGSVLIVGKCPETVLKEIYLFIKKLLAVEFINICSNYNNSIITPSIETNNIKRKIRKKTIIMEQSEPLTLTS